MAGSDGIKSDFVNRAEKGRLAAALYVNILYSTKNLQCAYS